MDILITDDHELFREGLKLTLAELDDEATFLDASNGAEAIAIAEDHPRLVLHLLDLTLPGLDGFETLTLFRQRFSHIPVAVLTASEDQVDAQRALANGARGFILKSADRELILNALRLIVSGGIYIPAMLLNIQGTRGPDFADRTPAASLSLTARQREVLTLMCEGKPNKVIARALGIAERTVKTHVSVIFRALQVVNRTQAVVAARKLALID
jgi:DNA-binding NarL/FixJ family response regulator